MNKYILKRIIGIFAISFFIVSCGGKKAVGTGSSNIEFIELGHGICSVNIDQIQTMENSPSGSHYVSSNFRILQQTDKIPAKLRQHFGVNYLLKSPDYKEVQIEFVWTFPEPITNEKGETFKKSSFLNNISTNQDHHASYALNSKYLVVEGIWKLQMFLHGEIIYEKEFYLE